MTASASRPRRIYGKATLILIHGGERRREGTRYIRKKGETSFWHPSPARLAICKFSEIYVKFNIAGTIVSD